MSEKEAKNNNNNNDSNKDEKSDVCHKRTPLSFLSMESLPPPQGDAPQKEAG